MVSRQKNTSASQSPTVARLACTIVAAAAATSDHGSMNAPKPATAHDDMWSSRAIQLGGLCGWPIRCHWRNPTQISRAPRNALTASAASDGAVSGSGGLPPVNRTVIATIATTQASQPAMKARPFHTPFSTLTISPKATIVTGISVIASPMITRSRTTRPSRQYAACTRTARAARYADWTWADPPMAARQTDAIATGCRRIHPWRVICTMQPSGSHGSGCSIHWHWLAPATCADVRRTAGHGALIHRMLSPSSM